MTVSTTIRHLRRTRRRDDRFLLDPRRGWAGRHRVLDRLVAGRQCVRRIGLRSCNCVRSKVQLTGRDLQIGVLPDGDSFLSSGCRHTGRAHVSERRPTTWRTVGYAERGYSDPLAMHDDLLATRTYFHSLELAVKSWPASVADRCQPLSAHDR